MNFIKSDAKTKTHDNNTTESGYGEMIYMEPGPNAVMSPVITEGRQTLGPRGASPSNQVSTIKVDLKDQSPQAKGDRPIKSLVVAIPSRGTSEEVIERSPKVINFGDTSGEYNIRTTNVRRSPKGGIYQTFTNIEQGNIAIEQPMQYSGIIQNVDNLYQIGNDSNIMLGSQVKQSPQGSIRDISYSMNPREGRDPMIRGMSPGTQNIDEINSSVDKSFEPQVQLNNLKNVLGQSVRLPVRYQNDMTMGNMNMMNMNMIDSLQPQAQTMTNNRIIQNTSPAVKYNNTTYNNMTLGDVKNLVKKFTKVYDPKKTKEGTLINENQVIIPGANDDVFKGRYRVLQKMNRLSSILLSKRVEYSPDRADMENRSFDETRKTFDRHTLNRSTIQKKKLTVRSPEHKFLYLSLAMLSSKGPNTEDRIILRRMRFEKGGVVDLAQEKRRKGEKVVIKNARQAAKLRGKSFVNTNPKFREKAAKLIQAWWRELKEIYNERLNMIIKIQSFWRGRWVRKYMYDILYLSFMYQSFCQIIQKVLVRHVRPYVFNILTADQRNTKNLLKNLILKNNHWLMLRIKPYFDRWVEYMKQFHVRNNKGRQLFDIRNNSERRKNLLMKCFDKWVLISKLLNNENNANVANREKNKYIGANKIVDGLKKLTKRNAFKNSKSKIFDYLSKMAKNKALNNVINKKKLEKSLLKKYFDRWKKTDETGKISNLKRGLSAKILTNTTNRIQKENLKDAFNKIIRENPKQKMVEKIIVQERIVEKFSDIDKKKGMNKDFFNGCFTLENAVLRLCYKYPLDAIDDKISNYHNYEKLLGLFKIKEKVIKFILNKYLTKWKNKSGKKGDKHIQNKLIAKLMFSYINKLKNRLLSKKLNQWLKKAIPLYKEEDTFKKVKTLDDFSKSISRKSTQNYGKEFVEKLRSSKAVPRVYGQALNKIINSKSNRDKNKLLHYLFKWLDKIRNFGIYDLKIKILQTLGNRNDYNNRRLNLGRSLHNWLMHLKENKIITKINETTLKDNTKNIAALLIKSLKRAFLKNDKESLLRNAIRTWLKNLGNIEKVYNDSINEAIKHLLRANILKNGRDLLYNNAGKIVLIGKKKELKNLLPYRRRYELILLLHYLLKWKNQMLAKRAASTHRAYRKNFLNNMFSKKDKERLIRAIYKWLGNCKSKINYIPVLYGLKQLIKTLCRDAFNKIKYSPSSKPIDIETIKKNGLTVTQALMNGDVNLARIIALRKIFLMNYLNKWRKNIKREIIAEKEGVEKEIKNDNFKKILKPKILKISNQNLNKYLNRWKDITRKLMNNDIQKIIYMKLLKNLYDKISKDSMRNRLSKWKNIINKMNHYFKDAKQAMELLRKIITEPIFKTFKTKIDEIEKKEIHEGNKTNKLKVLLNHRYANDKKNILNKYLNRWRKILDNDNEQLIKAKLLVNLLNGQNRKSRDNALNRLREVLLKWRIKISTQEKDSLNKFKRLREGLEKLINTLRKPYNKDIFDKINQRKKEVGGSKYLVKIITKVAPKIRDNILRKYFNRWKERLDDDIKIAKKYNKIIDNVFTNPEVLNKLKLMKNLPNPYKDLPNILKQLYNYKVKKAQKIIDFFRSIKPKKSDKIEERNKRLHFIVMKNDFILRLRHYFFRWIRIARMEKAYKDALIIRKFCKIKVRKVNKKKYNIEEFVDILKYYILKMVFDKLSIGGKKKRNSKFLRRIFNKNESTNKKILRDAFLKWKNLIPSLKKIDAITKIQSALRGMKSRKQKKTYNKSLNNLKYLYLKKDNNGIDNLRCYLMKWLLIAKRIQTDKNIKKIQKFLKVKKVHYQVIKDTNKLKDFFKKLLIKFIINGLKRVTKTTKDNKNFDELLKILSKIFKKKSYDDLLDKMKNKNRIISLNNVVPKVFNTVKNYFLPLYLKKWKYIAIDKRDEYVKIIQNFLRSKKRQKTLTIRKTTTKKINVNLTKLVKKLSETDNDKLSRILKIWHSHSRKMTLKDMIKKIQKFMHRQKKKKQEIKKISDDKIKNLFIKYLINQIKKALEDTNKVTDKLNNALNKINGIDKRYMTNNLLTFANGNLRKEVLSNIIHLNTKRGDKELLRRYLLKWKNDKDKYINYAKKLQKFFRRTKHKKKEETIIKTNDILVKIFNDLESNLKEILRTSFRKWQLRNQLLKCNDSSMIIQEFMLARIYKVLRDKIDSFFINLAKKVFERKLNQLAKFRQLRNAIIKTYLKRVIKKSQDNHNKEIITDTLRKALESKHFKIKDIYLRNALREWLRRSKLMTKKMNDAASKITGLFKRKKVKKEVEQKKNNLKSFKNVVNLKTYTKNPIRIYLWRYATNAKKLGAIDRANKIKKLFKKVKKTVTTQKKQRNDKNINDGVDILNKYNPNKKYAFDQFKKYVRMMLLNSILDKLRKNRKNNIEDFLNKLKENAKENKLNNLVKVDDNLWKRILKKLLKKWNEKKEELIKDEEKKAEEKKKEEENNEKKKINLKTFLTKKDDTNNNNLLVALKVWERNAAQKKIESAAEKIKKYLANKLKLSKAKNNWKKLVDLLRKRNDKNDKVDLLKKLLIKTAIDKLHKTLRKNSRKNTINDIDKKSRKISIINSLDKVFDNVNSINKNFLLRHYLNKWRTTKDKTNQKEKSANQLIDALDKISKINGLKVLNAAFLLKKFLHDLPYIRALDFMNRLKKKYEMKKKLSALGESLVKTKKDLDDKNKSNFIKALYKLYVNRALEKMIKKIKNLVKLNLSNYTKKFLKNMDVVRRKKLEYKEKMRKEGSNNSKVKRLQFRAHLSSTNSQMMEDRNTSLYLVPHLIDWINSKIKERKNKAFKKISEEDKYKKFTKYILDHLNKKLKKDKNEFFNKLKNIQEFESTTGPLLNRLNQLLRKYLIQKWMDDLKPIARGYKLLYLFKLAYMFKGIAKNRYIREIIRKWRFISFAKIIAKRKLELMYKDLHTSYLQMANEFFDEESNIGGLTLIKEFEEFNNGIGAWSGENPKRVPEASFCKKVNKKYVFDPVEVQNVDGVYPEIQKLYTETKEIKTQLITPLKSSQKGISSKKKTHLYSHMNEDEENIKLNLNNNFGEIQDERFGVSINSSQSGSRRSTHIKRDGDGEDIKERSSKVGSYRKDKYYNNGNLDDLNSSKSISNMDDRRNEYDKEKKGSYKVKERTGRK